MDALPRFLRTLPSLVLMAACGSLLALAELDHRRYERLMQEDGWAEWATFLAFSLAFGFALRVLLRARQRAWLERAALLALGLFCLFVAGEEISWGQRILGFRPPNVFLEHNYQQESNLHNLLKDVFDTRWMVFSIAALYGLLAPYVVYVARLPAALAPPRWLWPWFALVAWLEFSYPYELVGELAELLLGLLFLLDVLERARPHEGERVGQAPHPHLHALGWLGPIAIASALVGAIPLRGVNDLVTQADSQTLVAHTRAELDVLAARVRDGAALRSKLFRKREVHKRVYTAVQAGYLELEPGEYYLDAWNSPYWIAFERKSGSTGSVSFYSLGPNRRRDLAPVSQNSATSGSGGDDVSITIDVTSPARAERDR